MATVNNAQGDGPNKHSPVDGAERLVTWLANYPPEIARAIAARVALRTLPIVGLTLEPAKERFVSEQQLMLILRCFRAAFISWVASKYPDEEIAAVESAPRNLLVDESSDSPANYVLNAAAFAVGAVIAPNAAGMLSQAGDACAHAAIAAAGTNDARAPTVIWDSVETDRRWLENSTETRLVDQALWLADVRGDERYQANMPLWIRTPFDRMANKAGLKAAGFDRWIGWYRAILPNGQSVRPQSYFGQELDIHIANQSNDWWSRDPRSVNADITNWMSGLPIVNASNTARTRGQSSIRLPATGEPVSNQQPPVPPSEQIAPPDAQPPATSATGVESDGLTTGAPNSTSTAEPDNVASETLFLGDSIDPEVDYLRRSDLAFVLAARLNQVWDRLNKEESQDNCAGNSARWTGLWPKRPDRETPSGFVVHIDAPWGGGKTSFANFLMRLLNPYKVPGPPPAWMLGLPLDDQTYWPESYRRPWHIVTFNAWQHQHVLPPWWVFYQAIRKQTMDAVRTEQLLVEPADATNVSGNVPPYARSVPQPPTAGEGYLSPPLRFVDWSWCWVREMWWRLWTPDIRNKFVVTAIGIVSVGLFFRSGLLKLDDKGAVDASTTSLYPLVSVIIAALVGGAPLVWTVLSALSSTLLSGTPDAAKNYALGSGDPLDRFRAHFARMMASLKRPVLVVVDDLDRCEPTFVVELIRGMQTILKSSRVMFILLGDRDWIEECFTKVNETMKGIHVGVEHEFGARFAEKAIQFSFVLPEISDATRRTYVRDLLGVKPPPASPEAEFEAASPMNSDLQDRVEAILRQDQALDRENAAQAIRTEIKGSSVSDELARVVLSDLDRRLSLRAAADKTAEAATRHRLEALASVLPPNPRQIKRIINAITLLQEVARIEQGIQPGSVEWKVLALWIILMIEWPKSWFTLSTYPGLADRLLHLPTETDLRLPAEDLDVYLAAIEAKSEVMAIIKFQGDGEWQNCAISTARILKLRQILPPASGELIDLGQSRNSLPIETS